jgi:hypothetical protein
MCAGRGGLLDPVWFLPGFQTEETGMTPSEVEAELTGLRAQLSQLQEQQDTRAKAWASLAVQYRYLAAVMLGMAAVVVLVQIWMRDSSAMPLVSLLVLQALPLLLLRAALVSAAAKAGRA